MYRNNKKMKRHDRQDRGGEGGGRGGRSTGIGKVSINLQFAKRSPYGVRADNNKTLISYR